MKIEYWIIIIGIVMAFIIGGIREITYEEPELYFEDSIFASQPINTSSYTIHLDCDYIKIYFYYENETIEFCEWFKSSQKEEKEW